jgi:hypothetical protein
MSLTSFHNVVHLLTRDQTAHKARRSGCKSTDRPMAYSEGDRKDEVEPRRMSQSEISAYVCPIFRLRMGKAANESAKVCS